MVLRCLSLPHGLLLEDPTDRSLLSPHLRTGGGAVRPTCAVWNLPQPVSVRAPAKKFTPPLLRLGVIPAVTGVHGDVDSSEADGHAHEGRHLGWEGASLAPRALTRPQNLCAL